MILSFRRDCRAATSIEYGMMVAVLGVGLLLGGGKIKEMFGSKLEELAFGGASMRVENCGHGRSCEADGGRAGSFEATGQAPGVR